MKIILGVVKIVLYVTVTHLREKHCKTYLAYSPFHDHVTSQLYGFVFVFVVVLSCFLLLQMHIMKQ